VYGIAKPGFDVWASRNLPTEHCQVIKSPRYSILRFGLDKFQHQAYYFFILVLPRIANLISSLAKGTVMAKSKTSMKSKRSQKKSWFKRFLERVAKANQQSGGQLCAS
jgi:hypothetical protein